MTFLKKQAFGFWLSLLSIIAVVAGYVIYSQAIVAGDGLVIASGSQPFYESDTDIYMTMVSTVQSMFLLTLACIVASVVFSQGLRESVGGLYKVLEFVVGALRVVIPVLLMILVLNFLYGSFTGLGWTFFSNEELKIYPEAVAVGTNVITAIGLFAGALVLSLFGSFFNVTKKAE